MRFLATGHGPLLELPIGPGPDVHAVAMYRAIAHHRPLVNGYHGYWPTAFPERMALACLLPNPEAVAALRDTTGVELILVHLGARRGLDKAGKKPYACGEAAPRTAQWEALVRSGGRPDLRLLMVSGTDALFAVGPTT